jgi:probable rRNA maturation factor
MSIDIANEAGIEVDEVGLAAVARFTLDHMRIHPLAELSILLVDEQAMTDLHERWMGDVVLCPSVAAAQAEKAGHSTQDELELLCVHGILHLLGYDHAEPEEHAAMFGLQGQLLKDWQETKGRPGL